MIISFDMDGTIIDMNFDEFLWREEIPKLYAKKNGLSLEEAKKVVFKEYFDVGDEDLRWYDVE